MTRCGYSIHTESSISRGKVKSVRLQLGLRTTATLNRLWLAVPVVVIYGYLTWCVNAVSGSLVSSGKYFTEVSAGPLVLSSALYSLGVGILGYTVVSSLYLISDGLDASGAIAESWSSRRLPTLITSGLSAFLLPSIIVITYIFMAQQGGSTMDENSPLGFLATSSIIGMSVGMGRGYTAHRIFWASLDHELELASDRGLMALGRSLGIANSANYMRASFITHLLIGIVVNAVMLLAALGYGLAPFTAGILAGMSFFLLSVALTSWVIFFSDRIDKLGTLGPCYMRYHNVDTVDVAKIR